MKTQRLLLVLVLVGLLFCMSEVTAQTYYYSTTKTFNESGYTYQCDIKYGGVVLYNKANQYTYKNQTYKDGSYLDIDWAEVDDVQNETWTKPMAWDIVNKAFTTTEKKRFKDEALGITMIINPETGKVIEVSFDFMPKSGYATVAVSTYRKIETELKNKIWFTPTTEGKKANYLMRFWMQKVE